MSDKVRDPRFWYKSHGISLSTQPVTWEGGFSAPNLGSALGIVRQMSLRWQAKVIHNIAIYEIDKHGCIEEQPSLYQTYADGGPTPDQLKLLPGPKEEEKEAVNDIYEAAVWVEKADIAMNFTTVTLKE